MHPILIDLGVFRIYSFGFMLALSFLIGIYLAAYRARQFGLKPQDVLDLSVYLILAGVVGSRLLYVVFHVSEYRNVLDIFALWQGGATLYGGLLLAILAAYLFTHKRKIHFLLMADVLSPSLALGVMLTRIGCYLSGCCFGKPTSLPWGVIFPPDSAAGVYERELAQGLGIDAVSLHPTQLYASVYGLVILLVLLLLERRLKKLGGTFGAFLALYGVFRFTLDFFRFYEDNMYVVMGLTLNQLISIGLLVIGLYLLLRKAKRTESTA